MNSLFVAIFTTVDIVADIEELIDIFDQVLGVGGGKDRLVLPPQALALLEGVAAKVAVIVNQGSNLASSF